MYRKKVMVTLTGGGFLWESLQLIKGVGSGLDYYFVTTPDSLSAIKTIQIPRGKIYVIEKITTMGNKSFLKILKNTFLSFVDAYKAFKKVNPVAVICVGSSIAIPLCFWAKFFRKKAIFVESITRVSQPSLTGKTLSFLGLCDRFYVQWPEAVRLYRGSEYQGTVL